MNTEQRARELGRRNRLGRLAACIGLVIAQTGINNAQAQEQAAASDSPEATQLDTVVVTSRKRSEPLQSVPDAVTVFTAKTIEQAGIEKVSDFLQLTPNATIRDDYRAGVSYITLRGISTGDMGWAPVTYLIDGVPAGSTDLINLGALVGIERIEVLKGPQGALYGSGAIAGAINIITKEPEDHFRAQGKLSYGNGNDRKAVLSLSGPLSERVSWRLDAYHRDSDGLIKTTDGKPVDFDRTTDVRGKLHFDLEPVKIDVSLHAVDSKAGAATQQFLTSADAIDRYDDTQVERGFIGYQKRRALEGSVKLEWDLDFATLTSITAHSRLDQDMIGTASWQKPPATGLCGTVGGEGEAFDCLQDISDDFRVTSQDLRLTSRADQRLRWLVGASYLRRRALDTMLIGGAESVSGERADFSSLVANRIDLRRDRIYGIYSQLNYDLTDALEATFALRYDRNDYNTTRFRDYGLTQIWPTDDGQLHQYATDTAWQPKYQLAYHWNPALMTYASIARGFRSGYFNSGTLTAPEKTWNYELGAKSTLLDGRAQLDAALFHIDYSNQQYTSIIAEPPYRSTTNIPETKINGLEVEGALKLGRHWQASSGLGLMRARNDGGYDAPYTPRYTFNASLDYQRPLPGNGWLLNGRLDYRLQGRQYLGTDEQYRIGSKDYLNLRVGVGQAGWQVALYAKNLTDTRQAYKVDNVGFGYIRVLNTPRTYGVEFSFDY